jgi:GNAT superfamily N-acetyltransferase
MLHVRPARPSDADTIIGFQVRMAHETEGLTLDPDTAGRGVRAVFEDPAKGEYLLAEEDGEPVGCTLVIREWSDWRNGHVLWIHSLYVVPAARRRGVFRALYEHLRGRVQRSPDLHGLRLFVEKGNRQAQRAYEAMGMSRDHYDLYEWLRPPGGATQP